MGLRFDARRYPLMLHYPYSELYRSPVVKQADLVMALFYAGEAFTPEEKARDFAYYERLTVRDSSLSACIQAVVAAEVGHVELAYDYFAEAALIDLDDLAHNTRDGVHIGSLAGSCIAAIAGFGGLRDHSATLSFMPRLTETLARLAFAVRYGKKAKLRIEVEPTQATYTLLMGDALEIHHHGRPITVTGDHPAPNPASAGACATYAASRSRACVDAAPARAPRSLGAAVPPSSSALTGERWRASVAPGRPSVKPASAMSDEASCLSRSALGAR